MMKKRNLLIGLFGLSLFIQMGAAMAGNDVMGFSYNGFNMSNAESHFGLKDGLFSLVMRGMTNTEDLRGAGVFEGPISVEDKAKMEALRRSVCTMKSPSSSRPGNNLFLYASVTCDNGQETNGMIDIVGLGKDSVDISTPPGELVRSFFNTGEKIVKLDVSANAVPKDGRLLVTLRFVNSGKTDIALESPAAWEGTYNPIAGNSYAYVAGNAPNGRLDLSWFGGAEMINARDFPDGIIRISPGQFQEANFLVYPNDRFKRGVYEFGGVTSIKKILAPEQMAGRVDFVMQNSKVQFATDYPATQKELGEFEAYRRAKLFRRIHGIADEVEETGYYRAFGEKEERDDFPQLLKKGDKFPSRDIQQLNCGSPWRNGATAKMWRWEAYPEAQMTTNHRAECPRSGMWVPTIPSNRDAFLDAQLAGLLAVRWVDAGTLMPPLWLENADAERSVVWDWLGDQKA